MSYIGRNIDSINNISTLDNLSFNGSDATFNLTQNSVAFVPVSADALQIQIDGVIQANNFTISGSTLTFDFTPDSGSVCNSVKHFGVGLLTTVSDGAITNVKLGADSVNGSKIADDSISDEHLDITAITGQTAITSLADTDKFLVSDASDSGNLKYVEKQYLPSGTLVKLAQVDNSTSSSAVSSITLDYFSTTYDYYRFFATMGADTAASDWRVRFRDGGSDVTASYYVYTGTRGQINSGGTASVAVGHSEFFADRIIFANNSTTSSNQKVVCDWTFATGTGNSANRLQLMGNVASYRVDDVAKVGTFRGYQNAQSSNFYEGFKIYLSSGNIRYYNYALYGVVK